MAASDEPPALAYVEKTLADSCREEIDQEENIWRSLPFFAATLALQLAALFQVIDKLPDPTTVLGWVSVGLLASAGGMTLASISFLAASIYPRTFDYIAREPALLSFAEDLIRVEQVHKSQDQGDPFSALVTLKTDIARQYARATDHNRQINEQRARQRSIAGLAALGSVLMTVFLVGATYAHYLSIHVEKGHGRVSSQPTSAATPGAGPDTSGQPVQRSGAGTAPDAGRH